MATNINFQWLKPNALHDILLQQKRRPYLPVLHLTRTGLISSSCHITNAFNSLHIRMHLYHFQHTQKRGREVHQTQLTSRTLTSAPIYTKRQARTV